MKVAGGANGLSGFAGLKASSVGAAPRPATCECYEARTRDAGTLALRPQVAVAAHLGAAPTESQPHA